jgi:hypothetical protein
MIEMYRQQIGKPVELEEVFSNVALRRPMDITRDGRFLFYRMNSPDLWVFDQQTKQEIPIIRTGTAPTHWPRVSPDGGGSPCSPTPPDPCRSTCMDPSRRQPWGLPRSR